MFFQVPTDIPENCILGVNYSGMQDSAVSLVAPTGEPIFCLALEALSQVPHDGRSLAPIFDQMPWSKISRVAIATPANYQTPDGLESKIHPQRLSSSAKPPLLKHGMSFYSQLDKILSEKEFVSHQLSHVSASFWASGFADSLCLAYDSAMFNEPWFGGLYDCADRAGITALDQFDISKFANINLLYTFVTSVLGLMPNRDEAKVASLAKLGSQNKSAQSLVKKWFSEDYGKIEKCFRWLNLYSASHLPQLYLSKTTLKSFQAEAQSITQYDLAAALQEFTEQHLIDILVRAKALGWMNKNLCLSGKLFTHLNLLPKLLALGFENISVAPAAGDAGAALGAAWLVASKSSIFKPNKYTNFAFGPEYDPETWRSLLQDKNIQVRPIAPVENDLAALMSQGKSIAIFAGRFEFATTSRGDRFVLSPAIDEQSIARLNKSLNRSALTPVQMISTTSSESLGGSLLAQIILSYQHLSGQKELLYSPFYFDQLATPCSPEDMLKSFFTSGVDYLYIPIVGLIGLAENPLIANLYLRAQAHSVSAGEVIATEIWEALDSELALVTTTLDEKDRAIAELKTLMGYDRLTPVLAEKERIIAEQRLALEAYRKAFTAVGPVVRIFSDYIIRLQRYPKVKLGVLRQYDPKPMLLPAAYSKTPGPKNPAKVSIVTPSYGQAQYIERTIKSVLDQKYPNLEYFVRDGGSKDGTVDVLKKYAPQLSGWESLPDSGQSNAINLGFEKTSGEIMAWLNSDDILLPGSISLVTKYFEDHPDVDVVYGNRILIDHNDAEIGRWIMPPHDNEVLNYADYIPQETLFWRRSIWNKAGGRIDESFQFAMDWDFIVRLRDAGAKFQHLPRFIGGFRVHPNQKTSGEINSVGLKEMNQLKLRLLGEIPTEDEVNRKIGPYIRTHIWLDLRHRAGNRIYRNWTNLFRT